MESGRAFVLFEIYFLIYKRPTFVEIIFSKVSVNSLLCRTTEVFQNIAILQIQELGRMCFKKCVLFFKLCNIRQYLR